MLCTPPFANELSWINIPLVKIQRVEEWGTDHWLFRKKSESGYGFVSAYGDDCMMSVMALQILVGFEDVEGEMV